MSPCQSKKQKLASDFLILPAGFLFYKRRSSRQVKRKRYTEDLEFKISDEEADDADAAGRDSPATTSQSEPQVSNQVCGAGGGFPLAFQRVGWRVYSWYPRSSFEASDFELETSISCWWTHFGISVV